MGYNPFDKIIDKLTAEDLDLLISRQVTEGYFVEFKSRFQAREKIAHSVAAFANTYGGWLIVGVETNDHNVAKVVNGFDLKEVPDPVAVVRDTIRSHISPTPLFYSRVVELQNGNVVFLLEVPAGQDTPFITRDGRIYRRVADAKDPVSENNRFALDELVARGRRFRKRFKQFCRDERPKYQSDPPWLNVYLVPYPNGIIELNDIFRPDFVKNRMALSKRRAERNPDDVNDEGVLILLGVGQYTHQSVIFRNNDPLRLPYKELSLELFLNGSAKIHLPLQPLEIEDFYEKISGNQNLQSKASLYELRYFIDNAELEVLNLVRVLNLSETMVHAAALINEYRSLIGEGNWGVDIQYSINLRNVGNIIPYVDSDAWSDFVKLCGLPIMQKRHVKMHEEGGRSVVMQNRINCFREIGLWMTIAFGLPDRLFTDAIVNGLKQVPQPPLGKNNVP